ncbi:hypothetical protein PHSC3_000473 [Chlamydiales bacterium STE3]|nr:hypothetical protein PHSC3_000473 [Chlamydiales bacterium STE3]
MSTDLPTNTGNIQNGHVHRSSGQSPVTAQIKRNYPRVLKNVATCTVAVASAALLALQASNGELNPTTCALETAAFGAAISTFQHINLKKEYNLPIADFSSRWSLAFFETLWQAYLNIESSVGKEVIANFITGSFGYQFANDFFNLIQQERGSRAYYVMNDNYLQRRRIINKGAGFSTIDSPIPRFLLHTALCIVGIASLTFAYTTDFVPEVIPASAGYFLSAFGLGSILSQAALMYRESQLRSGSYEAVSTLSSDDISPMPSLSKAEWLRRRFVNGLQLLGPRAMIMSLFVSRHIYTKLTAPVFGFAGLAAGGVSTFTQISFERGLDTEVYKTQQDKNTRLIGPGPKRVRSTALKVDLTITALFAVAFLLWFSYGMSVSPWENQTAIGLLVGSTALSALLTFLADTYFQPGNSNRIINFLRYVLFENPHLLPLGSLFFTNVTRITDTALKLDSTQDFVFALMGIWMYGMFFGNVTALNVSKTRPSPAFSSVAAQFEMGMVFFQMLLGKKASQLG